MLSTLRRHNRFKRSANTAVKSMPFDILGGERRSRIARYAFQRRARAFVDRELRLDLVRCHALYDLAPTKTPTFQPVSRCLEIFDFSHAHWVQSRPGSVAQRLDERLACGERSETSLVCSPAHRSQDHLATGGTDAHRDGVSHLNVLLVKAPFELPCIGELLESRTLAYAQGPEFRWVAEARRLPGRVRRQRGRRLVPAQAPEKATAATPGLGRRS